ncbi:class I SAM-dependent methyltransferase [Clavibacter michiganensis subsp. insidiosus]|uniref:Class I SAM-dependent methyltransferase n=1 Tax=Clavibacter michiganensis subsp. insidiosus TaxID=33014 RepID=A0A399Q896_9MICO|nr:class I SAM-dependent methyltransferase [Clavibacter michiganensis]AWG00323.1 SAM-dependent methyltransferase [Clavibacter michiganensis subsp. insidiosus]OQJ61039.1 SAM-dependent methyltransferase [Clavibacter michiganensis subsp. insidiosus]RII85955.1 class I SAM-dependent methyltransferase [Clavibacter michiganensis subsp. insidiosus]RIJ14724.1 class I SAM-dependent methyltransferase [Clavibacter michiganensis subsp. insidiosus]RMC85818.1 class I SAM-dependent methyltransferase [Clavibac
MDRDRISDLAHADHPIASPLGDGSVDRLLALTAAGQRTVLDLGCGDGSWLLRALRREPALTAVGVDHSDAGFDRVREQAEREGLSSRLELVRDDARAWTSPDRFDVVLSVGATHAFGGLEPTLAAVDGHLRPGGRALVGECFWERPPTPRVLDLLGAQPDDYGDLAATVEVAATGWVPLQGHVSTPEEWDDDEWSWTGALATWAADNPDDPDRDQVMAASVEHRRAWLEGYRGTLGFLTMVLARSPGR